MNFIDTHCHIQSAANPVGERTTGELWAKAPDLSGDDIIANAKKADVTKMIVVGCDLKDSQLAVEFARGKPSCWASIGIHPHEAQHHLSKTQKSQFASLLRVRPVTEERNDKFRVNDRIVAIGECGLDYFYTHSPKEAQIEILKFQLDLALEHDLPVIFHIREAFDDFWPIFEPYRGKLRGVVHSFTDSVENLQRALGCGLYIGVNGIATFAKDEQKRVMYRTIPLERLLLETDAPFLTPVPFRGSINEPKHIRTIAEFLEQLRGESIDSIAAATTQNAETLFALRD